jgi:hypothetical protein
MAIDKLPQNIDGKNIPLSDDSSATQSSETHKFQNLTVTQTEPTISLREQTKRNAEQLAKVYIPMSKLSKKAIKGIEKARLTMARESMFPENVSIGRMDDTPNMVLKKNTLSQITTGAIPALTVTAEDVVAKPGGKLDSPKTLDEYFAFDPETPVGRKDICLFGIANDLQAYLEKREHVGVFSKLAEDEGHEVANIEGKYPIFAGVFSEYQKGKEVKVWNPRRAIILKAIKTHTFVVAGLLVGSFAPPIDAHVKLPTTLAKTLRGSNRLRKFLGASVKKVKQAPIDFTKGVVNYVADGLSKDKKAELPKIPKPGILKTKVEKLQDKVDKALEKEEQEKNKILMLRISYMPKDGLVPVGEKEISLRDVGNKLGMIQKSEVISEEGDTISISGNSDADSGFDESMPYESDSELDEILEIYEECRGLAEENAKRQG